MTDTHRPAFAPELRALLHPSAAFARPLDVVKDPDLTTYEKKAILSAWASDACAVDSHPALRRPPGAQAPITFDEVLDALKSLDDDPPPRPGGAGMRLRYRRDGPEPDSGGTAIM